MILDDKLRFSFIERLEITQSEIFNNFVENNNVCKKLMKWKDQDIGTFEGVIVYLEEAMDREKVIDNRNAITPTAIKTKYGAIKKLRKLRGGGKADKLKKTKSKAKRKIYIGKRGGKYYIKKGNKVYI